MKTVPAFTTTNEERRMNLFMWRPSAAGAKPGFTLIETIIYMALYAIIMGGALVAAYSIFGTSSHNATRAIVQEEGNFLVGKIDWAMTGISGISAPLPNTTGQTLQVTKSDATIGTVLMGIVGNDMTITRGATTEVLNNSNVRISATPFITRVRASTDGINPESITARFMVTATTSDGFVYSQEFVTVKYIRK